MKTKTLITTIIFIGLYLVSCNDTEVISNDDCTIIQTICCDIDSVIDFTSDGQNFYLLTEDNIYYVGQNGAIISQQSCSDVTGIYYSSQFQEIVKISPQYKIFSDSQDTINFNVYDISNPPAYVRYLTKNDSCYVTCVFMGGENGMTYSDFIGNVLENEFVQMNRFFDGVPCGLFYASNKLYYISNTLSVNETNFNDIESDLMIIDYSTNEARFFQIPTNGAVGIYKDVQDNYYTFSRSTNCIIKFREN